MALLRHVCDPYAMERVIAYSFTQYRFFSFVPVLNKTIGIVDIFGIHRQAVAFHYDTTYS